MFFGLVEVLGQRWQRYRLEMTTRGQPPVGECGIDKEMDLRARQKE